jgi:predicted nucleotidyltransferase
MDQESAIKISKRYLNKLKRNKIRYIKAYLFGSAVRGTMQTDSDIDLAIVLPDGSSGFDTEVLLMVLRNSRETIIEPHPFEQSYFTEDNPFVHEILKTGLRIA